MTRSNLFLSKMLFLASFVGAFVGSCITTNVSADDWLQFRGPNGNASADASTPGLWNETENIVWKTPLKENGASSPIVVGDKIFITGFSGYGTDANDPGDKADLKLHTMCFDRETGKEIWNMAIPASPNEQAISRRVKDHGYSSGTPVSDGKNIYSHFGVSGAVAYDLDGKELWRNGELGTKTAGFGSASSPAVNEDFVFINASIECGTLFALDKKTGKVAWKRESVDKSWSTPCLAENERGETELIINQKFTVFGLDPKTGNELWSCEGIQDYVVPVPIAHEGILYCLGGRSNKAMAIKLGGKGDVTETHRLWFVPIGANVTSPLYHDGHLYWASDKGIANCMNAENGEAVFRERMPTKERVYASIVRGGDKLYLTTRDAGVWVLSAKPEFEELALNKIKTDKALFNASPAIAGNRLLLRTDNFLYCIGEQ